MTLLSVDDALERILRNAAPIIECEETDLTEAAGRVLANDLVATRDQPPFPASAMDGYAVRAPDAARSGAELAVIGTAAAGHSFDGVVVAGQTVRIFTGAPVPTGADAILIQENAEVVGNARIRVLEPVSSGRFIRPAGLDFATGQTVLEAGMALDPGRLSVAAALNYSRVAVRRKPHVAILATGDELVRPGAHPASNQIIASNSFGVGAIARNAGALTTDLGIVPDKQGALEAAVDEALAVKADILVTLGGASVGDHDLVQAALTARGMTLSFWKVAMRPGKPLMSGRLGRSHVLGLPGNPVSSLVCAHLFLVPLVRRLADLPDSTPIVEGRLGMDVPANDLRQDYLRARIDRNDRGELVAYPFSRQDSSMLLSFAQADGLVIRPPHAPTARAGDICQILLLRG